MKEVNVFAEGEWPFFIRIEIEGYNPIYLDRSDATYLSNSTLTAIEKSETLERISRELGEEN